MEEINFEEAMKKLEQITAELEKGDLSLDEAVKKFEEGIKLSKECNKILEDSEKRINILINEDGLSWNAIHGVGTIYIGSIIFAIVALIQIIASKKQKNDT